MQKGFSDYEQTRQQGRPENPLPDSSGGYVLGNTPLHEDKRDEPGYAEAHGIDPKKWEHRKQLNEKKKSPPDIL